MSKCTLCQQNKSLSKYKYCFIGLPFSEKFSQFNIKEPRSSFESIDLPARDFPNVKSHFGDISKDDSKSKSGVMPSWTLKMPKLILDPEHFMINENPRNFAKEQIEKAANDKLEISEDSNKSTQENNYKESEGNLKTQNIYSKIYIRNNALLKVCLLAPFSKNIFHYRRFRSERE